MPTDELPDKLNSPDKPNSGTGAIGRRFRAKWTPASRAKFLARLAQTGNVRFASELAGFSPSYAYLLRRSESGLARAWDDALDDFAHRREEAARVRALDRYGHPIVGPGESAGELASHETVASDRLRERTLEARRPKKYRSGVSAKTPDPHGIVPLAPSPRERIVGRIARFLAGLDPIEDSGGCDGGGAGEPPP